MFRVGSKNSVLFTKKVLWFLRRSVCDEFLLSQRLSPLKSIVATDKLYNLGQRRTKTYDWDVGYLAANENLGGGGGVGVMILLLG